MPFNADGKQKRTTAHVTALSATSAGYSHLITVVDVLAACLHYEFISGWQRLSCHSGIHRSIAGEQIRLDKSTESSSE